jgi:uncharacterized protein (TIGR03085 family)
MSAKPQWPPSTVCGAGGGWGQFAHACYPSATGVHRLISMGAVSTTDLARAERLYLCELLEQSGPDAPTLCDGWTTRDLAAHIVVREGRPDAALGILGGPWAAWTERVLNGAASEPYEKLLRLIRNGPPIWSAFRLPLVEGQANTMEFFVYSEDIRRAQPGWQPRDIDPELADFLWDRLRASGKTLLGKAKVGVIARRTDVADAPEVKLKGGKQSVTLVGDPAELVLLAFGRTEHHATVEGEPEAVEAFTKARLGV